MIFMVQSVGSSIGGPLVGCDRYNLEKLDLDLVAGRISGVFIGVTSSSFVFLFLASAV